LKQSLLSGTYRPSPVRRHEIPKPGGGVRLLGIPTALDRFIQQAVLQVLTPLFEPTFSEHSYGFRPGKSAHQAVEAARGYIEEGYGFVVDMDLSKFFDRVNHDIVMAKVARVVRDKRVLKLIRAFLEAGVMENGVCVRSEEGTPQGGPLSPLLANIMLNDLDWELEKRGHRFARYADDCNVYVKSRRAGERVMASVRRFVEGKLKLKVNEEKSAVDRPGKRKFLGFSFIGGSKPRIRVATKTRERFEERIREITSRSNGRSMASRIRELNSYLRGWMGYYRIARTPSVCQEMDQWIRRRLRMCLLKQWKRPKTVRRNLVALGIPDEWAQKISGSRKAYWRLANTPQVNKALGIAHLRNQGLLSLTDLYAQNS
ncbi:MAG: group II intron reverse transcriptase/maturase, partial [Clostridia bacterium]|nr:group II intron reverse transcriptase/maturase [Clostridia bacterium]